MSTRPPKQDSFGSDERDALRDLWAVYDLHYDDVHHASMLRAANTPELRSLVQAMTPEQLAAERAESRDALRRAIEGDWEMYAKRLSEHGARCAAIGIELEVCSALADSACDLVPHLVEEYAGDVSRLTRVLLRLHEFFDRAKATVAQSYLQLKQLSLENEIQAEIAAAERITSFGMLAAAVAHEINNPLTALTTNLELLRQSNSSPVDFPGALDDAYDAAMRVDRIVRDLAVFSHTSYERHVLVNLPALMNSSVRMAWNEIRNRARLVKDYEPILPAVEADESRLGQAFLDLLFHAAHSIAPGDPRNNEICVAIRSEDTAVLVEVSIRGAGISPDLIPGGPASWSARNPDRVGADMGLAICRRILREMDGELTSEHEPGKRSAVLVRLPAGVEPPVDSGGGRSRRALGSGSRPRRP